MKPGKYKRTKEIRAKQRKTMAGTQTGENNHFYGKKHTEETKKKMSEFRKKIHLTTKQEGKDNPNWKGGITATNLKIRNSLEYTLWRKAIFERDEFTCQKCGQLGGVLRAHHIHNFADYLELRLAIDNGITLCNKCHLKFHTKYGRKNNTFRQLQEFFNK